MKKLILLLTVLLTGLLTTELRAQFPIYGDLIVYGQADFSKNLTVDSTITAIYLIVDSIKLADSSVTSCYSGTLVNTTYVDDVIGAYYIFDNGLTESGGNVDLGDFTAHVDIDGGGFNYLFETLNYGYGGGFNFYPTTPLARFYMEISGGARKELLMAYTSGGIEIIDNIDNMGLYYDADYSANSTARWCTDRAYVDSYYSGSLTDGAPTDAELDAAIGSTPSGVGANRKFLVKDTDGTGLYYDVISDGSNWIYFPGKSGSTAL